MGLERRDDDRDRSGGSPLSREQGPVGLAIEWSPRGVVAYDHASRQTRVAEDLGSLAFGGRSAVLALSRRGVFVRTARVPNASRDEVRMILMMRVGELLPIPSIDLAWDFALTDDVNDEGRLAILAAVPCADLRRALEAMGAAGIKVRAAVPLALGSTILAREAGLVEAAVVERADDGPAVDVVSGGSLRASRATPPSVPLETEVVRALGLAGLDSAPILAAGGAEAAGATQRTERTALMALADAPLDKLDLRLELPEAVAARSAEATRKGMRTAILTLAASALVSMYAFTLFSDAATARKESETRQNSRLQTVKNAAKKATASSNAQIAKKEDLDLAFSPAQKISDILTVATVSAPKGIWLNNVTIERGKAITLRGTALNAPLVAAYVKRLDTDPQRRFRDVQLTNANNTLLNQVPVTVFVVQAFPVGNLPFVGKPGSTASKR